VVVELTCLCVFIASVHARICARVRSTGSAPKQKEFGQCETDEERLDLLKDRLGVIIQGMNKLKGPGIFTHAPDLKRELSSFANPYGHSSLKSSI
jgi:hypothetical protein